MLRQMCGKTKKDKIRNERIRETVNLLHSRKNETEQTKMAWTHTAQYPQHSTPSAPVRKCDDINLNQARGRGKSKLTWKLTIQKNIKDWGLCRDLAFDRMK